MASPDAVIPYVQNTQVFWPQNIYYSLCGAINSCQRSCHGYSLPLPLFLTHGLVLYTASSAAGYQPVVDSDLEPLPPATLSLCWALWLVAPELLIVLPFQERPKVACPAPSEPPPWQYQQGQNRHGQPQPHCKHPVPWASLHGHTQGTRGPVLVELQECWLQKCLTHALSSFPQFPQDSCICHCFARQK